MNISKSKTSVERHIVEPRLPQKYLNHTRVSQKFCNILLHASLQHDTSCDWSSSNISKHPLIDYIHVVGALSHYALLHSMWFENCKDEHAMQSNLGTYTLWVRTGL